MFAATCRTPSLLSSSSTRFGGRGSHARRHRSNVVSSSTIECGRKKNRAARRVVVVRGGGHHADEIAQLANGFDGETLTTVVAAVLGIAAGLGIPIFFVTQEQRDKERIEEIRELNRATLKATGEQMSEEEIRELRPDRYLDRREFKDDD